MNINKITYEHNSFPEQLRHIPDPPQALYVIGDLSRLTDNPIVAIVGSRKVTPYGKAVTHKLASECARAGVVIVSGLALGVDAISHQATLEAGGTAVAILPCGLDAVYPRQHHHIATRIVAQGGTLISEYPEGVPPLKPHFIARNRLVSGLSDAVLITEAAERSGTLHTANFALDQGKTVMAVPGNITSPYSVGTNNLIKAGALPVTKGEDILHALGLSATAGRNLDLFGSTAEETLILRLLENGVSDATELLALSKLDVRDFNQTLTMLEINGHIRPLGAGHWSLR